MRIIASIAICLGIILLPPCDAQTQETARLSLASLEGYYVGTAVVDYQNVAESPERLLKVREREPVDFLVLIENTSDHPIRLYRQWNTWGYGAIHFVVEGTDGKQMMLWRTGRKMWTKNYQDFFDIPSGKTHAVPICFTSTGDDEWQVVEKGSGDLKLIKIPPFGKHVRIKAVLEQTEIEEMDRKNKDSSYFNVHMFTNKIESSFESWENLIRRNRLHPNQTME